MTTASAPRCSTITLRAADETAIRPASFSRNGCRTVSNIARNRDRTVAAWNVATIGPSWIMHASNDRLGGAGSCTWTTSNAPSRSQRRTRAALTMPNCTRATDPLYGIGTALPAITTYGARSGESSSPGASTETWWPSPMSCSARSRTCAWTPPGVSHEYGHTMPMRMLNRPFRDGAAGRRARASAACASRSRELRCRSRTDGRWPGSGAEPARADAPVAPRAVG